MYCMIWTQISLCLCQERSMFLDFATELHTHTNTCLHSLFTHAELTVYSLVLALQLLTVLVGQLHFGHLLWFGGYRFLPLPHPPQSFAIRYLSLEYLQPLLVHTNIVSFLRDLRLYFTTDRIYHLHFGQDGPLWVFIAAFLLHPHPIISPLSSVMLQLGA